MDCIFGARETACSTKTRDDGGEYVPDSADERGTVQAPPASNTYVRYLFDSQLFNVPNNYDKFKVWLTYLHSERIFEVCYVVAMTSSKVRGAASGSWWTEARSRGSGGTGKATEVLETEAPRAMFNTGTGGEVVLRHPINRYDVRDLVQNVQLTGGTHEWLDLKVQLCLPSILLFVKLRGSPTVVPNADHTVQVDMRELQLLKSEDTLGEKLVRIVADLRTRFFNAVEPDFHKLRLLTESDVYAEDDGDRDVRDTRKSVDTTHENLPQSREWTANATPTTNPNLPPPVPVESLLDAEELGSEARNEMAKRRRVQYRNNIGTGVVDQVYIVSDFK